jgi:chemotaxis protein CheX
MNVKFMNPFVEAANEVLTSETGLAITRGTLSLQKTGLTTDDVTVVLSIVGQVQGVVLYGMSQPTALTLVSRMMGQEFPEFDSLAQSGIAELGNVITGRATIKLSHAGYATDISPPTLIHGKGVTVSTLDFSRVMVPLATQAGEIVVHIALRESPEKVTGLIGLAANDKASAG